MMDILILPFDIVYFIVVILLLPFVYCLALTFDIVYYIVVTLLLPFVYCWSSYYAYFVVPIYTSMVLSHNSM